MPDAPLSARARLGIALLVLLALALGAWTVNSCAFLQNRQGDAHVYFRAAWAVSAGEDPYAVTDHHGWHYTYPVAFAILMVPFADAPPGAERAALALPVGVSITLWYVIGLVALAWGVHRLCRAIEDTHPDGPRPASIRGARFWWVRAWPVMLCFPAVANTLVRGQVNTILLALLCGYIAAVLRGHRARAGWWLAAATCLKVIPGLLILYPLVKRDLRGLAHFALAMVVGMVLIPAVALGPSRAWEAQQSFVRQTVVPGLTTAPGAASRELTDMNATANQSFRATFHKLENPTGPLPSRASTATKVTAAALALALIAVTFLAARRVPDPRYRAVATIGGLSIICVAASPVSHMHYMVLTIPAVCGLMYWRLERTGEFRSGPVLNALFLVQLVLSMYPRLPGLPAYQFTRDLGVTMFGALLVWAAVLVFPAGPRRAAPRALGPAPRLPSARAAV
jgi:hypothetical protein